VAARQGRTRLPCSLLRHARAPQRAAAAPSLLCPALAASPALLAGRAGALIRCERGVRRRRSRRHARRSACAAARAPPCGAAKLARTCVPERLRAAAWWASSRTLVALLSHALTGGAGWVCMARPCRVTCGSCFSAFVAPVTNSCQLQGLRLVLSLCGQAPGHLLNACEQTTANRVFPVLIQCHAATMCIALQNTCQSIVCRCTPVFAESWLMQTLLPAAREQVRALGRLGLLRRPALTWRLPGWL